MTLVSQPDLQLRAAAPPRRSSARRLLSLIVLGFVALSLLRFTFDAGDLTSSGAVRAALVLAIPIGLAGLGGLAFVAPFFDFFPPPFGGLDGFGGLVFVSGEHAASKSCAAATESSAPSRTRQP